MTRKKVLIVEDDAVGRQILHKTLVAAGFDPIIATDAMTALTETQRNRPDAIVLDLGLPAGGGFTFLQRLKSFPRLALIPIVVVSGQDRATSEPRARDAGAVAYIEKPAKPEDVVAAIKSALE